MRQKGLVIIVLLTVFFSCKKENGLCFLRVIPPADTTIKNLQIFDASGSIPVDGKFYQANEYVEIKYDLFHVVKYQIKDWTSELLYDEFDYTDLHIHEYMGEFEQREEDVYYTLTIKNLCVKDDEAILNSWTGYYFYVYDYFDRSHWTTRLNPDGL
ncbi:MAG: hypothetical protein CVU05_00320 [Bacteroidetes bacterium HGW-Bacteroidetes-21]|jgi:hypothetical protein|nr:MAG: hypothetical protein CVU05_00320 [Bacteroidetes bacterium HGW-Bacteroidetes-21]